MPHPNRRQWLTMLTGGLMLPKASQLVGQGFGPANVSQGSSPGGVRLAEFQPRSMLHVKETQVPKSRFPVIDVHTHLTGLGGSTDDPEAVHYAARPEDVLPTMDRRGIATMVNLTGGRGKGLEQVVREFDVAHPGRFITFTEPWWSRTSEQGYSAFQAGEIERAHRAGARGLKVLKTLGLYLRDGGPTGRLVPVDDPRFDPMWETCAALNMPVCIHIADPEAFFLPIDRFNERIEELQNHPDWSFHGRDFPSFRELLDARNRLFARHPRVTWVALHFGHHAEDLDDVAALLDRFKNVYVEPGARIAELGRQPRRSRQFFERYQDRIVFGTDAVPKGDEYPQQVFGDALYQIYYRFLETEDEYFDYAPAPIPPQGRWRIYGLGLPEPILKKVYHDNAARLLRLNM